MSVTTQGGATVSVAPEKNGQARGLPHLAPHNALDEAPSKTTTTRFLYDALHRRLGRVKDNGETTVIVYEGWNVIAEKTPLKAAPLVVEGHKTARHQTQEGTQLDALKVMVAYIDLNCPSLRSRPAEWLR